MHDDETLAELRKAAEDGMPMHARDALTLLDMLAQEREAIAAYRTVSDQALESERRVRLTLLDIAPALSRRRILGSEDGVTVLRRVQVALQELARPVAPPEPEPEPEAEPEPAEPVEAPADPVEV